MNFRFVVQQLGLLLLVMSALLIALAAVVGVTAAFGGPINHAGLWAMLISGGVGGVIGAAAWLSTRHVTAHLGRREALLLVALTWVIGAALAGLPYYVWAHLDATQTDSPFRSAVNCYFEAMSGLTTTGATIVVDIEALPPTILFWRALTHWLGGLGIVVLFVAVLPSLGTGGKKLFRVEAPGPSQEGVKPHIRETARVLWLIYLVLTAAAVLSYWAITPMSLFDSVCHGFSTIATGGLANRNASMGAYDSIALDAIVSVFMLLAGVNFAIYYAIAQGRFRVLTRDVELRVYLALKIIVILIVMFDLTGQRIVSTSPEVATIERANLGEAARAATFTTIALQTGTGFCTVEHNQFRS